MELRRELDEKEGLGLEQTFRERGVVYAGEKSDQQKMIAGMEEEEKRGNKKSGEEWRKEKIRSKVESGLDDRFERELDYRRKYENEAIPFDDEEKSLAEQNPDDPTLAIEDDPIEEKIEKDFEDVRTLRLRKGSSVDIEDLMHLRIQNGYNTDERQLAPEIIRQHLLDDVEEFLALEKRLRTPNLSAADKVNSVKGMKKHDLDDLLKRLPEDRSLKQQEMLRRNPLNRQKEKIRLFSKEKPLPIESPFFLPYYIRSPRQRAYILRAQEDMLKRKFYEREELDRKVNAKEIAILAEKERQRQDKERADRDYGSIMNTKKKDPVRDPDVHPRVDQFMDSLSTLQEAAAFKLKNPENDRDSELDDQVEMSPNNPLPLQKVKDMEHFSPWYLDPATLGLERLNPNERFNKLLEWEENFALTDTVAFKHGLVWPYDEAFGNEAPELEEDSSNNILDVNAEFHSDPRLTYVGPISDWLGEDHTSASVWEAEVDFLEPENDSDMVEEYELDHAKQSEDIFRNRHYSPDLPFYLADNLTNAMKEKAAVERAENFSKSLRKMKMQLGYIPAPLPNGVDAVMKEIDEFKTKLAADRLKMLEQLDELHRDFYMNVRDDFSLQATAETAFPTEEASRRMDVIERAKNYMDLERNLVLDSEGLDEEKGTRDNLEFSADEEGAPDESLKQLELEGDENGESNYTEQDAEQEMRDFVNLEPNTHLTELDQLQMSEENPEDYMDLPTGINSWAPQRDYARDLRNVDLSAFYTNAAPTFRKLPKEVREKIDFSKPVDHSWKIPMIEQARKLIQKQGMWTNVHREQLLKTYARAVNRAW